MNNKSDQIYQRGIIGFDLRRINNSQILSIDDKNTMVATIDSYHWSVGFPESWEKYQHELGLFSYPFDAFVNRYKIDDFAFNHDVFEVAFDLPIETLKNLMLYYDVQAISIGLIRHNKEWLFLGFDVVDPISSMSGLNTKFKEPLGSKLREQTFLKNRNRFNLFDDSNLAFDAAIFFNNLVPQHAPFVPCGIWIKKKHT